MPRAAVFLVLAIACSSRKEPARESAIGSGIAPPALREPYDTAMEAGPPARTSGRPGQRANRPIEVLLRSSPPGATAAVDGAPIGPTPAYWAGDADGREHEFTFVLSGYASARYRFVPITSGVVHARLEVLADDTGAGVPELLSAPRGERPGSPPVAPMPDSQTPDAAATQGAGPEP